MYFFIIPAIIFLADNFTIYDQIKMFTIYAKFYIIMQSLVFELLFL